MLQGEINANMQGSLLLVACFYSDILKSNGVCLMLLLTVEKKW